MDRLFADLDSNTFAIREKATKALAGYGESAVPGVRKRLERGASIEVRERVTAFLAEHEQSVPSADRVRQIRAVELLEGIGSPAAKEVLTRLTTGDATAPLTLDAVAAVKRLERKEKP